MRAIRTLAIVLAALAAVTLLAAWLVPPLLDWNRYRDTIGAIAAARLGRPVEIGAGITVHLFPEAVVTASNVTLPDRGDGISAKLGALRLQVALGPLLAGRIVARDLVLGAPVLHLPWPLPPAIANPPRPLVPPGFNATLEDGVLAIGAIQFNRINATLRADTATGALAAGGSVFAADHSWRFQARLDPASGSTGAPLTLHVRGAESLRGNTGDFTGRLSDAALTGTLDARGDDLDDTLPRLPGGWTARAGIALNRGKLEASDVAISAVGASAHATGTVSLEGQPRLAVQVTTPGFQTAWWWPTIKREILSRVASSPNVTSAATSSSSAPLGLPFELELSVERLALLGDALRHVHLAVSGDGANVRLTRAEGEPPGGGTLALSGAVFATGPSAPNTAASVAIAGPFRLETMRAQKLLAWLRPLAPALVDAAASVSAAQPDDFPASLSGKLTLSQDRAAVTALEGSVAGQAISGDVAVSRLQAIAHVDAAAESDAAARGFTERPRINAHLQVEDMDLDGFTPSSFQAVVAKREALAGFDADMRLSAATAQAGTMDFTDLVIDARNDADGLTLRRASADLAGAHIAVSGDFRPAAGGHAGTGWAIGSGKVSLTTQDASALRDTVPQNWRLLPALWRGAADAELSVSGSSDALNLQLSADRGDLRLEAETLADTDAATATTTLTLRHPGAPRLLADLGVHNADTWLGTGSLALLLHASTAPGRLTIQDFDLIGAALRLHGAASLARGKTGATIDAHVDAESLALPGAASWSEIARALLAPSGWGNGLSGHMDLAAAEVLVGGAVWARDFTTELMLDQGMMLFDPLAANVMGGSLAAQMALSLGSASPQVSLRADLAGAALDGPITGLPIDPLTGSFDATLAAEGPVIQGKQPWQNLAGTLELRLQDTTLGGLDLGRLSRTYANANADPTQSEAELRAATTGGVSAGLAGMVGIDLVGAKATITPSTLSGNDGALAIEGTLNLDAQTAALHLTATNPGQPAPPPVTMTLEGAWATAKPRTDLTQAQAWITNIAKQNQPAPQPQPQTQTLKPKRRTPPPPKQ